MKMKDTLVELLKDNTNVEFCDALEGHCAAILCEECPFYLEENLNKLIEELEEEK